MPASFGPIMQNGYVVPDVERAVAHWTEVVGVGPFFLFERVRFKECWFRGKPVDPDLTVAIAYWGDMQIELIKQHNGAPSIYTDFTRRSLTGLQHVGVMTDSVPDHLKELAKRGITAVQHGETAAGARFAYLDTDDHPGGMIELIEDSPIMKRVFQKISAAARDWDGTQPLRRMD